MVDLMTFLNFLHAQIRWSTIPMMYPFSFLFETPSTAFVTLGVGNVFLEMITTVTIFVLENSQEEDLEEVSAVSK